MLISVGAVSLTPILSRNVSTAQHKNQKAQVVPSAGHTFLAAHRSMGLDLPQHCTFIHFSGSIAL
jgi:hypothetical protein